MGALDYYKEKCFLAIFMNSKILWQYVQRSSCKNPSIELGTGWDHEVLSLAEMLLVIDCYWRKENQFSIRVCALGGEPWFKTDPTARSI